MLPSVLKSKSFTSVDDFAQMGVFRSWKSLATSSASSLTDEVEDIWEDFYQEQKKHFEMTQNPIPAENLSRMKLSHQDNPFISALSKELIVNLCKSPLKDFDHLFPDKGFGGNGKCGIVNLFKFGGQEFAVKKGFTLNDWKIGAGLNHPNIIKLYCYLQDPDNRGDFGTLVMEAVHGKTFKEIKELRLESLISVIHQLSLGMIHFVENDIAPQDLHLGNIMLDQSGRLKLIDFGAYDSVQEPGDYYDAIKEARKAINNIFKLYRTSKTDSPDIVKKLGRTLNYLNSLDKKQIKGKAEALASLHTVENCLRILMQN